MAGEVRESRRERGEWALEEVQSAFRRAGWTVVPRLEGNAGDERIDLVVERPGYRYLVQVKSAPEGRADRILPIWSQACLQASHGAGLDRPLAVVVAPRITESAAESVLEFAARYAPEVSAGVIDHRGLRRFQGEGLKGLDADPRHEDGPPIVSTARPADLFTDLNQWLLKTLLAPELPEELLSAPRERYRNASELAEAARVSTMSGYRFVDAFKREGYLETSGRTLRLVRRKRLFTEWRRAAARPAKEMPMRLLAGTNALGAASRLAAKPAACLGLFAAADTLGLGFVSGVPPYVYVRELATAADDGLVPAAPYEAADLFVREPRAAKSVFRGAVDCGGIHVSDVIQVWLDVANHPSRGREQADLVRDRVLKPLIEADGLR